MENLNVLIKEHIKLVKDIDLELEQVEVLLNYAKGKIEAGTPIFSVLYDIEKTKTLNALGIKIKSNNSPLSGNYTYIPVRQFDLNKKFIAEHKSLTDAAIAIGDAKYKGNISNAIKREKEAYGFYWDFA